MNALESRLRRTLGNRLPHAAMVALSLAAISVGGCSTVAPPAPPDGVLPSGSLPNGVRSEESPRDAGADSSPVASALYEWRLPAGFPVPRVPAANPMTSAKVELGRHLFYDRRLSANGTLSCAGCHRQEAAFTDGRARSLGSTGDELPRSAMSLANVAYNAAFNWADTEVASLEEQMMRPLTGIHPVEMGIAGREREIEARLAADPLYRQLFERAYPTRPDPITLRGVVQAIATFERTLISGNSPYDRYVFWGEREAMSEPARRGMALFFSERLACGACHGGLMLSGPIVFDGSPEAEVPFHNTGLYSLDGEGAYPEGNRGLFESTGRAEDMGRFRAPSLRNVALTAPYMHDGSVPTLDAVLDHYAAGGRARPPSPLASDLLRGFELTAAERQAVLAFLDRLTDDDFVRAPAISDPWAQKLTETPSE